MASINTTSFSKGNATSIHLRDIVLGGHSWSPVDNRHTKTMEEDESSSREQPISLLCAQYPDSSPYYVTIHAHPIQEPGLIQMQVRRKWLVVANDPVRTEAAR